MEKKQDGKRFVAALDGDELLDTTDNDRFSGLKPVLRECDTCRNQKAKHHREPEWCVVRGQW